MTSVAAVIGACQNGTIITLESWITDALSIEAMASLITVARTSELRTVFSTVAGLTHTLAINTHTTAVTVVGTCELATILSGKTFVTIAGTVDAASTVIAVVRTDEFGAVEACPRFITNTLIVYTSSTAQAVVEAVGLRAVLTDEALLAQARPFNTVAVVSTVQQTELNTTVITTEALEAFAFAIQAATLVLAVIGALRFSAVGTLPPQFTDTAAGFAAPVPTAITVRLCGYLTCNVSSTAAFSTTTLFSQSRQLRLQHLQPVQDILDVWQLAVTATCLLGDVDAVSENNLIITIHCMLHVLRVLHVHVLVFGFCATG